jgi:glutamate-1-semialdehyde aminotransferase
MKKLKMLNVRKGQKLWNEAKKIIPGGSQLLSKRVEMILPELWPAYFQKAKGILITDLDGNKLFDFERMSVGACILGYADSDVNLAVKKAVDLGTMTTLNAPEEVELAKVLLKLNPWAGMVRFGRMGGESMSIAVRIARAKAGKDQVAFCGYHGWHDWYLSTNLASKKNLDAHIFPAFQLRVCQVGSQIQQFLFTIIISRNWSRSSQETISA